MDIKEIVAKIKKAGGITLSAAGGWRLHLTVDDDNNIVFVHYNPWQGDEDQHAFLESTNKLDKNGMTTIVQEPTLGIPLRDCGVDNDGKVVGFLVTDENGDIIDRFSLSKLVYVQEHSIEIDKAGKVIVDGTEIGYIGVIFLADKNRMVGYVAVIFPGKPDEVREIEMEDLLMYQIPGSPALKTE